MSPGSKTYSAANVIELDESVAIAASDFLVSIAFPVAQVKSFYIVSDKDILLEVNSSSSPTPALSLKANIPYHWTIDSYDTFKLTTNVTQFFFTNASGVLATVRIRVLLDPTLTGGV